MTGKLDRSVPAVQNPKALLKVAETFKTYLAALKKLPLSAHTKRAYETRLQHFLGFLGMHLNEYPDALTNPDTRDYLARDYKQYLKLELKSSPQTVNSYLTAIDAFFIHLGLGKADADREDLQELAPQSMTTKEQKDFVRAVERCKSPRDRALALLILNTGIRISECKNLDLDDVLFSERKGILKIRNGKGGLSRDIPLNTVCRDALRLWLQQRDSKFKSIREEAFFLSNRGSRLSVDSIDHTIRRIAKQANLNGVSSHTLRHTCLTNLLRQGTDVVIVAQVGGHRKLETTMRYTLASLEQRANAMENLPDDR